MTDWELLQTYLRDRSESAFARLVDRHWRMVLTVCRRETDDLCAAEDAAQLTFLLLAKKAKSLRRQTELPAWLFVAARFTAKNVARRNTRRKMLETRAAESMANAKPDDAHGWPGIEPYLNDAISTLKAPDRAALLLRYFDEFSTADVAAELGISESAARVRLSRAVGRLRDYFKRHHLYLTDAALVAILTKHAVIPAHNAGSVALAKLALSVTFPSGLPIADRLIELLKGMLNQMVIAKVTFAVVAAVTVGLGAVGVVRVLNGAKQRRGPVTFIDPALHADTVIAYSAQDLFTDPTAGSSRALPFAALNLTRQGDVTGTYTLMSPGKYGQPHFTVMSYIASTHGVKTVDDVGFGYSNDSAHIGGSLLYAKPGVYAGGRFNPLPMPGGYGSVRASAGNRVVGEVLLKGTTVLCMWTNGKFKDLSQFVPRRDNLQPVDVSNRGDVLLDYEINRQSRYALLTADHRFVDLDADLARMNDHGDVLFRRWNSERRQAILIRSAQTGQNRLVEPQRELESGLFCAFNDRGDILYECTVMGLPSTQSAVTYFLITGTKVKRLDIPVKVKAADALISMNLLDDQGDVAGCVTMPDGKRHVMLFRPK